MPHVAPVQAEFLLNPGQAVSPITGNTEHGSAAYDPATGEAFYAVYHNSAFRLFRTTEGYRQLVLEDDSVVEVGTILTDTFDRARNIGLTWIDGVLYALIIGSNITTGQMASRIYTMNTTTGAGTLVGSVGTPALLSDTTGGTISETEFPDTRTGGEIIDFGGGVWGVVASLFTIQDFGGVFRPEHKIILARSSDSGASWTIDANVKGSFIGVPSGPGIGHGAVGPLYHSSNSFGFRGGYAYAGVAANSANDFHWFSNGGVWTQMVTGTAATAAHKWPWSTSTLLYEERDDLIRYTASDPSAGSYTSTGVDLNDYGIVFSEGAAPHVCNIHTTGRPYLIATKLGKVMGLGTVRGGWVIGRVGPTW